MRVTHFTTPFSRLGVLVPWVVAFLAAAALNLPLLAATPHPPAPTRHVTDFARVLSPETVSALNHELEAFERATSSQIVAAVFKSLPAGEVLEDHVTALYKHWKIGLKKQNNGALLAIFTDDRTIRIEVGYGLEAAIPDALAKRIIDGEIVPAFRSQRFDEGVTQGVTALMAAARGEYQGTGRTVADGSRRGVPVGWFVPIVLAIVVLQIVAKARRGGGVVLDRHGRRIFRPATMGGWRMGGGGFSGGGGGGFRGGGGFSGGGGASGRW